ncbi:MAG TPA: beta-propeller fold lactonase family protein [Candidatus Angelobacter sp.]|nr:beta-propeller fold lactonase family protein [Candidatus Angelobacter sp.]
MRKIMLFAILSVSLNALAQPNFVYTNDSGFPKNTVSAFQVNADGSLTLLAGSPFATGGSGGGSDVNAGKIATARGGGRSFLYAANNQDGTISAFRIDPDTGQLAAIVGSPFPAGTASPSTNFSLAASPLAKFLFSTDEVSTLVHVFAIDRATGALAEIPDSPFNVGAFSEGMKVSPNGRFLVVGLKSIDAVGVFAIGNNGALTQVPGSPFLSSGAATAVDVNCANNRVFVSNAGLSVIDVYRMSLNGNLTMVPGSPFPSGATITVNALTLSADNRFLFTSDLFDDKVSSLAVGQNGTLTGAPGSPFAGDGFMGAIASTRAGDFVFASVVDESAVDGWRINPDGTLTPVPGRPFFTGAAGFFVQALTTFPAPRCQEEDDQGED